MSIGNFGGLSLTSKISTRMWMIEGGEVTISISIVSSDSRSRGEETESSRVSSLNRIFEFPRERRYVKPSIASRWPMIELIGASAKGTSEAVLISTHVPNNPSNRLFYFQDYSCHSSFVYIHIIQTSSFSISFPSHLIDRHFQNATTFLFLSRLLALIT